MSAKVNKYAEACRVLNGSGSMTAAEFGEAVWPEGVRSGRVSSVNGGGDYSAQMLLGRLRSLGLTRTVSGYGPGCSRWELTPTGCSLVVWLRVLDDRLRKLDVVEFEVLGARRDVDEARANITALTMKSSVP